MDSDCSRVGSEDELVPLCQVISKFKTSQKSAKVCLKTSKQPAKLCQKSRDRKEVVITTPILTWAPTRTGSKSRKRSRSIKVGWKKFPNMHAAELYFRVGKLKKDASPCVLQANLDEDYPIVYEEWQKHKSTTKFADTPKEIKSIHYRCRRQRSLRTKNNVLYVAPSKRRRQADKKAEYIGCGCQARYHMQVNEHDIIMSI